MNSLNKLLVSSVSCSSSVLLSPAVVSLFSLSVKHFVTLLRKVTGVGRNKTVCT